MLYYVACLVIYHSIVEFVEKDMEEEEEERIIIFCVQTNQLMRSVLIWDITWHRVVTVYRRFETMYRSQRRAHQHSGTSLKSNKPAVSDEHFV
jgi:hypothetical protein